MKQLLFASILHFLLVSGAKAQIDSGVHFEQALSWAQVKEKASRENKFIFVDCFATWCGPCKAMDMDIYRKEKLGNYLNEHFVSVKMQMDTSAQDNEQVRKSYADAHLIMQDNKVNEFPTFLFFSPDGNILHRDVGYKDENGFTAIAQDAMDPEKQYYTLLQRYDNGNLDTSYMKNLARSVSAMGDKELAGKIANDYINQLSGENLYTPDNIWFMIEFTATPKERGFAIFRDHADRIHQSVTQLDARNLNAVLYSLIYKTEIKPYMNTKNGGPDWAKMETNVKSYDSLGMETYQIYKPGIIFNSTIKPALDKDPTWTKILLLIKNQHAGNGQEFLVGSSVVYYLNAGLVAGTSKDCTNFMAAATYYFKNYYSYLTADPLNTWAWTVFQRSMDKSELEKALVWSDSCRKLSFEKNAGYLDTYANLLYKLSRVGEAIVWEEKSVALAPDNLEIQNDLSKMKKGEKTW